MTAGRAAAALLAALLVLLPAQAAAAQETQGGASLAGVDVRVTLGDGSPDTVEVTYRLTTAAAAGDTVSHQFMPRPGATVQDVEAGSGATGATLTGDGVEVSPAEGADGYTLRYRVARDEGAYAVPLPVPDLPTRRGSGVVIRTLLPPGQRLTGEFLPSVTRQVERGGRVELQHHGGELPSVVLAEYGTGGARLTISDWVTGALVLAFAAIVIVWWLRERRESLAASREVSA